MRVHRPRASSLSRLAAGLALTTACLLAASCGGFVVPLGPVAPDAPGLRREIAAAKTIFIAGVETAGLIDSLGLALHIDQTPLVRGVANADQPFARDLIAGSIFKDFRNIDIRPAAKGYVVFAAKPRNATSAIFCYGAYAHIRGERFWLLGNYNLGFPADAQAPWPVDDWARGRPAVGAFHALVADVTSPGVYYLGDYKMDLNILDPSEVRPGPDAAESVLDSATLSTGGSVRHKWKYAVSITADLEGAKQQAAALGLDPAAVLDLSGKWLWVPKADLEQNYLRQPGDPMPQTYQDFLRKMAGEK